MVDTEFQVIGQDNYLCCISFGRKWAQGQTLNEKNMYDNSLLVE